MYYLLFGYTGKIFILTSNSSDIIKCNIWLGWYLPGFKSWLADLTMCQWHFSHVLRNISHFMWCKVLVKMNISYSEGINHGQSHGFVLYCCILWMIVTCCVCARGGAWSTPLMVVFSVVSNLSYKVPLLSLAPPALLLQKGTNTELTKPESSIDFKCFLLLNLSRYCQRSVLVAIWTQR